MKRKLRYGRIAIVSIIFLVIIFIIYGAFFRDTSKKQEQDIQSFINTCTTNELETVRVEEDEDGILFLVKNNGEIIKSSGKEDTKLINVINMINREKNSSYMPLKYQNEKIDEKKVEKLVEQLATKVDGKVKVYIEEKTFTDGKNENYKARAICVDRE